MRTQTLRKQSTSSIERFELLAQHVKSLHRVNYSCNTSPTHAHRRAPNTKHRVDFLTRARSKKPGVTSKVPKSHLSRDEDYSTVSVVKQGEVWAESLCDNKRLKSASQLLHAKSPSSRQIRPKFASP